MDVNKRMGPDKIRPKLLKYLSNEIFINAISKLFKKCMEYEKKIPYIQKTTIVIPLYKKGLMYLKSNYQLVSLMCFV